MSSNKFSIPELKKTLRTYKNDELIKIILDCYKTSEDVKNYVGMILDKETTTRRLCEETKNTMTQEFFPNRGEPKFRLAVAKKAISDFNKLCSDIVTTLDLMIYYVELGVDFTNNYGDIDERFYISMESMYEKVLKKIRSSEGDKLFRVFKDRLANIVKNTDGIGWGFHDQLAELYYGIEAEYEE